MWKESHFLIIFLYFDFNVRLKQKLLIKFDLLVEKCSYNTFFFIEKALSHMNFGFNVFLRNSLLVNADIFSSKFHCGLNALQKKITQKNKNTLDLMPDITLLALVNSTLTTSNSDIILYWHFFLIKKNFKNLDLMLFFLIRAE